MAKRIRIELRTCCICSESGYYGFTDTFNIILRENETSTNFADIIAFTIGVQVHRESASICDECKRRVIEFYHFKKKSQSKHRATMINAILEILQSFIGKNNLKAVTIEESADKLMILGKPSVNTSSTDLKITNVYENVNMNIKAEENEESNAEQLVGGIKIKKEKVDDEEEANTSEQVDLGIKIKTEKPDDDDEEQFNSMQDMQSTSSTPCFQTNNYESPPFHFSPPQNNEDRDKVDQILEINREILAIVKDLADGAGRSRSLRM